MTYALRHAGVAGRDLCQPAQRQSCKRRAPSAPTGCAATRRAPRCCVRWPGWRWRISVSASSSASSTGGHRAAAHAGAVHALRLAAQAALAHSAGTARHRHWRGAGCGAARAAHLQRAMPPLPRRAFICRTPSMLLRSSAAASVELPAHHPAARRARHTGLAADSRSVKVAGDDYRPRPRC